MLLAIAAHFNRALILRCTFWLMPDNMLSVFVFSVCLQFAVGKVVDEEEEVVAVREPSSLLVGARFRTAIPMLKSVRHAVNVMHRSVLH